MLETLRLASSHSNMLFLFIYLLFAIWNWPDCIQTFDIDALVTRLNAFKLAQWFFLYLLTWLRSNLLMFVLESDSCLSPVSPYSPVMLINTFASVPAPRISPVYTVSWYSISGQHNTQIHTQSVHVQIMQIPERLSSQTHYCHPHY